MSLIAFEDSIFLKQEFAIHISEKKKKRVIFKGY